MRRRKYKDFISHISEPIMFSEKTLWLDQQFYSIDEKCVIFHDDALSIEQLNTDWFRIWSASSGISNNTSMHTNQLPQRVHYTCTGNPRDYSLHGNQEREAFVFSYITDGTQIVQPSMTRAVITSKHVSNKQVPPELESQMTRAAQHPSIGKALGIFNTQMNVGLAQMAVQLGLPIIFDSVKDEMAFYSNDPIPHPHFGLLYARGTTPIRKSRDRVVMYQAYEALKKNGNPMDAKSIGQICEWMNRCPKKVA